MQTASLRRLHIKRWVFTPVVDSYPVTVHGSDGKTLVNPVKNIRVALPW